MIEHETLLVTLVKLVGRIPLPPPPATRQRGRPPLYPDRLFLQALVIMIVRHVHTVHTLLGVLAQPTPEMQTLRALLTVEGRFPTRRTWERRLQAIPTTLPAQIGCLGRALVAMIRPWANCGRAAAIDSTVLRARGGVWHKKDREAGLVPPTSIATEAHGTKSGWHGWGYGGFAQKVGLGLTYCIFNEIKPSIMAPILSFCAKPRLGVPGVLRSRCHSVCLHAELLGLSEFIILHESIYVV